MEKLENLNKSQIKNDSSRKISVPIFDKTRAPQQITTIKNGKFVILSPAKRIQRDEIGLSLNKATRSKSEAQLSQFKKISQFNKTTKEEKREPTKDKKKKKRKKIILVDAPGDTSRVIERKINVTPVSEPVNLKIVDLRKDSNSNPLRYVENQ